MIANELVLFETTSGAFFDTYQGALNSAIISQALVYSAAESRAQYMQISARQITARLFQQQLEAVSISVHFQASK